MKSPATCRCKENESAYLRAMNIHEATVGLLTPVCELLNAQGTSGIGAFAVTKNKMEWSIIIHQMGVRNPKTGRIDSDGGADAHDKQKQRTAIRCTHG